MQALHQRLSPRSPDRRGALRPLPGMSTHSLARARALALFVSASVSASARGSPSLCRHSLSRSLSERGKIRGPRPACAISARAPPGTPPSPLPPPLAPCARGGQDQSDRSEMSLADTSVVAPPWSICGVGGRVSETRPSHTARVPATPHASQPHRTRPCHTARVGCRQRGDPLPAAPNHLLRATPLPPQPRPCLHRRAFRSLRKVQLGCAGGSGGARFRSLPLSTQHTAPPPPPPSPPPPSPPPPHARTQTCTMSEPWLRTCEACTSEACKGSPWPLLAR